MDALAYDLKNLTLKGGDGSFLTRKQRHRGLQLMARELAGLGYKLPGASSLKPKHITALVESWKGAGLNAGTLRNRMGWLRWWAEQVRKTSVLPRDNAALGIEARTVWKGDRTENITKRADIEALPEEWMRLAVRLQLGFGLRLEESLKFQPGTADKGAFVALQAGWCKGGRARTIPLTMERQRDLLDDVHTGCGLRSIIPPEMSYIQARKALEKATAALGIRNMHRHRHWYAQRRYEALAGFPCPAKGGKTYQNMSRAERATDYRARLAVSRELGHNRVSITDAYLGPRFGRKAPDA